MSLCQAQYVVEFVYGCNWQDFGHIRVLLFTGTISSNGQDGVAYTDDQGNGEICCYCSVLLSSAVAKVGTVKSLTADHPFKFLADTT